MRVVLDTNVCLSAILFGGTPEAILGGVRDGLCEMLLTQALLDEVLGVLGRKFDFTTPQLVDTERELRSLATWITPTSHLQIIAADPDDDRILECAADGDADVVVSGDRHLLGLRVFRGTPIISPAEFAEGYL
jgi:putative PIN family toxin of toxin-antitoxin system